MFDLDRSSFEIVDPDVVAAFKAEWSPVQSKRTPLDALRQIGSGGWGSRDIDALRALSELDFYDFFKTLHGDDLQAAMYGLSAYRRIGNLPDTERDICRRAERALRKIGEESAINRRRVRKYGIDLDQS